MNNEERESEKNSVKEYRGEREKKNRQKMMGREKSRKIETKSAGEKEKKQGWKMQGRGKEVKTGTGGNEREKGTGTKE